MLFPAMGVGYTLHPTVSLYHRYFKTFTPKKQTKPFRQDIVMVQSTYCILNFVVPFLALALDFDYGYSAYFSNQFQYSIVVKHLKRPSIQANNLL